MKDHIPYLIRKPSVGGIQKLYRFSNRYGASLIQTPYSYGVEKGLWELAVIEFESDGDNFSLSYDTPITDDVLGYLTMEEAETWLKKIELLAKNKQE